MTDTKQPKKKRKFFLKSPIFAAIMLVLAVACILFYCLFPLRGYGDLGSAYVQDPSSIAISASDRIAVVDRGDYVFVLDPEENLEYILQATRLKDYAECVFMLAEFDTEDNLYVSAFQRDEDRLRINREYILKFDRIGNFVSEVCRFDYSDITSGALCYNRLEAMQYYEGSLHLFYVNLDGNIELYALNPSNHALTKTVEYIRDDYAKLVSARPDYQGSYCLTFDNGEIGCLTIDGEYEEVYKEYYNLQDGFDGFLPYAATFWDEGYLVLSGIRMDEAYYIDEDGKGLVLNIYDLFGDEIEAEGLDGFDILFSYTIDSVYTTKRGPAIFASGYTWFIEEEDLVLLNDYYPMSPLYSVTEWLAMYALIPGIVFLILGLISLIGNIMHWKMGIIGKQLLLNIPVVVVFLFVMLILIGDSVEQNFMEEVRKEMFAVSEIAVRQMDGDLIETMQSNQCVEEENYWELVEHVRALLGYNLRDWSKNTDIILYLCTTDEVYPTLVNSLFDGIPYQGIYLQTGNEEKKIYWNEAVGTAITEAYSTNSVYLVADTPIYNSKGEKVAVFELSMDCSDVDARVNEMLSSTLRPMLVCVPILVFALILVSIINAKTLKKASQAVAQIAKGDFSSRIEKIPKDEVGDICRGVNDMASRLDEFFATKDKNEKFYYKFVPEKFRELLHKENFTDLALGDAESADLTVLFCDIRAFSLNSEMMTAKENFEFVNVIYGKAGPIIRKHNGFVDKYIGDAVMALFENADDAVQAGIELYRDVVLEPETASQLGVSSINIGIGIHSGMARVGIVGENERLSGTVISNTVNISSRLESLTKTYNTAMLISKDTLDRMEDPDSMNMRYLGMVQVAGVNEVKALYEVLDCLDEERKSERLGTRKDFREAVRLFHLGQLEESLTYFEKVKNVSKNDIALDLYINTVKEKLASNDASHNVFRFTRK